MVNIVKLPNQSHSLREIVHILRLHLIKDTVYNSDTRDTFEYQKKLINSALGFSAKIRVLDRDYAQ
jgi:hypothetical protein